MLDKILKGLGVLVLVGLFCSLFMPDSKPKDTQVKSLSGTQATGPKKDPLADSLRLTVTKIEGGNYNTIANAYSEAVMTLVIENASGQKLSGFAGDLIIKDMFGDVVANASYKYDKDIPPGTIAKTITLPLNIIDRPAQRVLSISKWTTEFQAATILTP